MDLSLRFCECLIRAEVYSEEEEGLACLEERAGEGGGTLGSLVGVRLSGIVSWVRMDDHLLDTPGVTEGLRCLERLRRSLWRLIWSLSLCLESLVTEEPRNIGDLVTRGEGGGAIGVTEHPLRLVSEIIMTSSSVK